MPWKNSSGCWNITVIKLLSWTKPWSWRDWSQEKWSLESKQAEIQQQNAVHQECIPETIHIVNIKLGSDTWLTYREFYLYTSELETVHRCVHVVYMCTCHGKFSNTKCGTWTRNEGHLLSPWTPLDHLTQFRVLHWTEDSSILNEDLRRSIEITAKIIKINLQTQTLIV